jgi:hypothetical protein
MILLKLKYVGILLILLTVNCRSYVETFDNIEYIRLVLTRMIEARKKTSLNLQFKKEII